MAVAFEWDKKKDVANQKRHGRSTIALRSLASVIAGRKTDSHLLAEALASQDRIRRLRGRTPCYS